MTSSHSGQVLASSRCFTMQDLQNVCKHSVTVVGSTKYPLQILQVIFSLSFCREQRLSKGSGGRFGNDADGCNGGRDSVPFSLSSAMMFAVNTSRRLSKLLEHTPL